MLRIRLAEIAVECAEHRRGGWHAHIPPRKAPGEIDPREQPGAERLRVSLHPGELAREEEAVVVARREGRAERGRAVEVRVPMDAAEAQELRVAQARNHREDALLLGNAEPRLEADEVPHPARAVLAPQLHHRMRLPAGSRIGKAHRLHRTEARRLPAPPRHLLDRQASLEVGHLVEIVARVLIGSRERVDERLVLVAGHRAVEVVVAVALPIAREGVDPLAVERVGRDDRRDGVVERECSRAKPL